MTIRDLRGLVLHELDHHEWLTPTQVCNRLDVGHGLNWYRVALILERLCVQGYVEIKDPHGTFRRFRRARRSGGTNVRGTTSQTARVAKSVCGVPGKKAVG